VLPDALPLSTPARGFDSSEFTFHRPSVRAGDFVLLFPLSPHRDATLTCNFSRRRVSSRLESISIAGNFPRWRRKTKFLEGAKSPSRANLWNHRRWKNFSSCSLLSLSACRLSFPLPHSLVLAEENPIKIKRSSNSSADDTCRSRRRGSSSSSCSSWLGGGVCGWGSATQTSPPHRHPRSSTSNKERACSGAGEKGERLELDDCF
jgi:hypothetical protein